MDPITAIGLISSILTFIDFGTDVIKAAKEIHGSASGARERTASLKDVVLRMEGFATQLLALGYSHLIGQDRSLCELAEICLHLSQDITKLLEKIRAKSPKSKRQSLVSSLKDIYYQEEKKELEQRLERCPKQPEMQLNFRTRWFDPAASVSPGG
jgi:hypothetical protein